MARTETAFQRNRRLEKERKKRNEKKNNESTVDKIVRLEKRRENRKNRKRYHSEGEISKAYVALSRVRSLEGLRIEELDSSKITGKKPCNNDALAEMEKMRTYRPA